MSHFGLVGDGKRQEKWLEWGKFRLLDTYEIVKIRTVNEQWHQSLLYNVSFS